MKKILYFNLMLLSLFFLGNAAKAATNNRLLTNVPAFSDSFSRYQNAQTPNLLAVFDTELGLIRSSYYGALAIDGNQGKSYGFAYNYSSLSDAESKAVAECGRGCYVVRTFGTGSCAAYAADQTSGSSVYGWGEASSSGTAQSYALNYCRQQGGGSCIVRAWGCNSR